MSFMFTHILSCLWVFMAVITELEPFPNWKESFSHQPNHELYLTSFYYIITTMTTVGYGDISPTKVNPLEMLYGILLMIVGVVAFTFGSATLTSILANYDN